MWFADHLNMDCWDRTQHAGINRTAPRWQRIVTSSVVHRTFRMQAYLFRLTVGRASEQVQPTFERRRNLVSLFIPLPAILPSVIQD